jgi:CubicO group peptidase (beta-lactamase class C family)
MKTALYIILGLVIVIIGFFVWFFKFYLKIEPLEASVDEPLSDRIEKVDGWLTELQKENQFNGALLFIDQGEVKLSKGYGFTDHRLKNPISTKTSFRLASVSKQFTAAGIMLLKEKGKLDFDAEVSQYIKGFPYPKVTIRHLLNQVSGVPDAYMDLAKKHKKQFELLTNEIALELLIKANLPATNPPNEKFVYSNTNYIILARIIEVVSGLSFEDFMKKEVFDPLHMKNTRVWNLKSKESSFPNQAEDFKNIMGKIKKLNPSYIDGVAGDGAVFSSVNDFVIWDQFWTENHLLSQETLKEAFKKPVLNSGKESNYGFGWLITPNGMWHNGSWLGANTVIIRNTKENKCLVILDNMSNLFFFDDIMSELNSVLMK